MHARGFTVIELMVAVAIAASLTGLAVWYGSGMLTGARTAGAARQFIFELRSAGGIAARINRPVQLIVDNVGDAGCNPSWRVQTIPNVGETPTLYNRICINREFPGVVLGNAGLEEEITCPRDVAAGQAELVNCSLCEGTVATTIYPSGEVRTPGAVPDGATIIFSAAGGELTHTRAVGIRDGSGQTSVYRPDATGAAWECP